MKQCTKCKEYKPLNEFSNNKRNKDGKQYYCKACIKQNYENNKEKYLKYRKQYRIKNKDKIKQYLIENKEQIAKQQKQYQIIHKNEIDEYQKQYQIENKEQLAKYKKEWQKTPQGKLSAKNNDHKRRLIKLGTKTEDKITLEQWNNILSSQNNCCILCNRKFTEDLKPEMVHIIPLSRWKEFPDVDINSKDNIQALCKSCNSRKYTKLMSEL